MGEQRESRREQGRAVGEQVHETVVSAGAKRRRLSQLQVTGWPGFGESIYIYIYLIYRYIGRNYGCQSLSLSLFYILLWLLLITSQHLIRSYLPALLDLDRRQTLPLRPLLTPNNALIVRHRDGTSPRPRNLIVRPCRPFNVRQEVGIVEAPERRVLCAFGPEPRQAAREDVSRVGVIVFGGAKGSFEDGGEDGQAGDCDAE